jgi:hypothetical protein
MIDLYTKVLLTVIAAALVAIVAQNAVGALQAQNVGISRVAICDRDYPNDCARVSAQRSSGLTVLLTGQP